MYKVASFSRLQKGNESLIIVVVGTVSTESPGFVLALSEVAGIVFLRSCLQLKPVSFNQDYYALPTCCTFHLWAESNAGFVVFL